MRVITGIYKGRRFDVPHTFKARPTTDFAKENLFNVLRGYIDLAGCRALDLFAGTGSITLELLSRGCESVTSVELDREHYAFIASVMRKLEVGNCRLLRGDALRYVTRCKERYDLIFADPPYTLRELPEIPNLVINAGILNEHGLFILEHSKKQNFTQHPCFVDHRAYGSVNFSLFSSKVNIKELDFE